MKNFILFAIFALVAGALVPGFINKTGGTPAPSATAAKPEPTPAASSSYGRTMTVRRDKRGHYQVQARVDGRHMDFLVDTGASVVAIPEKEAARLGVRPSRRDYTVQMKTAKRRHGRADPAAHGRGRRHHGARRSGRGDAGPGARREPARHVVPVTPAPLRGRRRQAGAGAIDIRGCDARILFLKDPHQWSTVTGNDRFFIMLGLLVAFVFLLPVTLVVGQMVGLLLDVLGYVLGLTPRP